MRLLLSLMAAVLLLSGCFSDGDEINAWMAEQRGLSRPKVTPISEPKKFVPQDYTSDSAIDPFNPQKLTQALRRESAAPGNMAIVEPEMARRKEPLEAMPLDSMAMVGSMSKEGAPVALVQVDSLLYQVKVGNYLGQNFGKILKISETEIQIREIVQDSSGDWVERQTSMRLQERGK
jgi:type IV pilus assembly protein PilP